MRRTAAGGVSSRCYKVDRLEQVLAAVRHAPDTYLSQASFVTARRRVANLSQIRAAWVDLDCYNVGATPSDSYVSEVLAVAREMGLPQPSYVVRSGRGLYAKWIFDTAVGAANLAQWSELQRTLVAIYRAIGADAKSRDAARVLRALGTINSKADTSASAGSGIGREVHCCWSSNETIDFMELCAHAAAARFVGRLAGTDTADDRSAADDIEDVEDPGVLVGEPGAVGEDHSEDHSFEIPAAAALIAPVTPVNRVRAMRRAQHRLAHVMATGQACTDIEGLRRYSQEREPIMLQQRGSASLNWRRFVDLRDLAIARGGVAKGWRDEYLFWMANSLAHAQVLTPRNFWTEIEQLGTLIEPDRKSFDPTRDGSMGTLFRRLCVQAHTAPDKRGSGSNIAKTGLYRPTNRHLIELFEISEQEQRNLSTLVDAAERARRREAEHPERCERRQQRQQRDALIVQQLQQGTPAAQIAQELGVSRQAVYRVKDAQQQVAAPTGNPLSRDIALTKASSVRDDRLSGGFAANLATNVAATAAPSAQGASPARAIRQLGQQAQRPARRKPVALAASLINRISDLLLTHSHRQIAAALGLPKSAVQRAARRLQQLGIIPSTAKAVTLDGAPQTQPATSPQAAADAAALLQEIHQANATAQQLAHQAQVAQQRLAAANAAARLVSRMTELGKLDPAAAAAATSAPASTAPDPVDPENPARAATSASELEQLCAKLRRQELDARAHTAQLMRRLSGANADAPDGTPAAPPAPAGAGAPPVSLGSSEPMSYPAHWHCQSTALPCRAPAGAGTNATARATRNDIACSGHADSPDPSAHDHDLQQSARARPPRSAGCAGSRLPRPGAGLDFHGRQQPGLAHRTPVEGPEGQTPAAVGARSSWGGRGASETWSPGAEPPGAAGHATRTSPLGRWRQPAISSRPWFCERRRRSRRAAGSDPPGKPAGPG